MFLKHDNKYYQELNYKMMSSYLTHELKQFIYDLAFQETERLFQILQTKYVTQFKARGFMKEGKTPDYLKLNNPSNEVRDPIRRDGTKIMSDRDVDDDTLRSIIDDLLQLPVIPDKPSVVLPKSSGNELEDLREHVRKLTEIVNAKVHTPKGPGPVMVEAPATLHEEIKSVGNVHANVPTDAPAEKIKFTIPVNQMPTPSVAEEAIAAVESYSEEFPKPEGEDPLGTETTVEDDQPLTAKDEGSTQS